MQHLRKSGGFLMKNRLSLSSSLKSYNGLSSFVQHHPSSKYVSDMGFAQFSSTVMGKTGINGLVKRGMMNLGSVSNYARIVGHTTKVIQEVGGLPMHLKEGCLMRNLMTCQTPFQLARSKGTNPNQPSSVRSFSSRASRSAAQNRSEARKDISTVEDPFDAPTYNIPEKPVTFTEGASYTVIILGGIFIACGAIYGVLTELIFQPKEYKVFDKALDRVQNDSQVRVRIGSPIIGFGSESVNRAARQRIPNRKWKDEDGVEHIEINFFIRGPRGNGAVYAEMFKDKVDKRWKYTYLVVQIKAPVAAELMLESYVPA